MELLDRQGEVWAMKKNIIGIAVFLFSMVSFCAPVKSMIGADGTSVLGDDWNPTAADYVQEDILCLWDGIENAGWGVHDSDAHVWKNLIEGGTSFGNSSMSFGPDYMTISTTIYGHGLTSYERSALAEGKDFTIELLVEAGDTTWNTPLQFYGTHRKVLIMFYNVPKRIWYESNLVIDSSVYMTVGETCLFTFVREGEYARGYINGQFVREKVIDNTIGMLSLYSFATAHKQKRISIYSRALTDLEIKNNYMVDKMRFGL